jgi:hypothetical protein
VRGFPGAAFGVRVLFAGFFLIGTLVLVPASGWAAPQAVKKGSTEWNAIQKAQGFLRDMGETKTANRIGKMLRDGNIRIDKGQSAPGKTSVSGAITLNDTGGSKAFLAGILVHELVHVDQGGGSRVGSNTRGLVGDNPAEVEGWSTQIGKMWEWSEARLKRMKGRKGGKWSKPAAVKAVVELEGMISETNSLVGEFSKKGFGKLDLSRLRGLKGGVGALKEWLKWLADQLKKARNELMNGNKSPQEVMEGLGLVDFYQWFMKHKRKKPGHMVPRFAKRPIVPPRPPVMVHPQPCFSPPPMPPRHFPR